MKRNRDRWWLVPVLLVIVLDLIGVGLGRLFGWGPGGYWAVALVAATVGGLVAARGVIWPGR